jgi:hypothetical protein
MLYGIPFVLGLVLDYPSPFILYEFSSSLSAVNITQHLLHIVWAVQKRTHFINLQHSPWFPIGKTARDISLTFSIVYTALFSQIQEPVILYDQLLEHLF